MQKNQINKTTLQFLKDLSTHNNRDWFNQKKEIYLQSQQNVCNFADDVIIKMSKHDQLENESGKKSLFRIYNDIRFSKDKTPYNPRFAFSLSRATKHNRGGYYVHIKPRNNFLACGFFAPNPDDLKRIRLDIERNYKVWNKFLKSKNIKNNFGELKGDKVVTAPRGFSADHAAIELLRYKQFILRHDFTDSQILSPTLSDEVNQIFKSVRPFFNYLSEVLTTNLNGESII